MTEQNGVVVEILEEGLGEQGKSVEGLVTLSSPCDCGLSTCCRSLLIFAATIARQGLPTATLLHGSGGHVKPMGTWCSKSLPSWALRLQPSCELLLVREWLFLLDSAAYLKPGGDVI